MITKDKYIECVKLLEKFFEYEDKVYTASEGVIDLMEMSPLVDTINKFIELLEYCTKDGEETDFMSSTLTYFLFENNGTINSAEDLWNNHIIKAHPEIEEK